MKARIEISVPGDATGGAAGAGVGGATGGVGAPGGRCGKAVKVALPKRRRIIAGFPGRLARAGFAAWPAGTACRIATVGAWCAGALPLKI